MRRPLILLTLLAGLTIPTAGCWVVLIGAGAAAGAGTVAYVNGDLESDESTTLERGRQVAIETLEEENYTITRNMSDAPHTVTVEGERPGSDKVIVKLESRLDTVTNFKIRVGTFGDEGYSRRLLESMRKKF